MRVALPVLVGWLARPVVVLCTLLNTRMLIDVAHVEAFAALSVVQSLAPWLALLNFGVPNAAQNRIAELRAQGGLHQRVGQTAVAAAFWAAPALLPVALLVAWGAKNQLIPPSAGFGLGSLLLLIWSLCLAGSALVFNQVLYARHQGTWPAVAPAVQALATSLLLFLARAFDLTGSGVATICVAMPVVAVFLLSAQRAGFDPGARLDRRELHTLLRQGRGFLVFSIAGAASLSCDYLIMSRLFESAAIAQYNIVSRSFSTLLALHAVLLAAAWTPISDRYFRADLAGLRRYVKLTLAAGLGITAILGTALGLAMSPVVDVLSGNRVHDAPLLLVAGWFAYILMRVWSDTFATALLACRRLSVVNRYVVVQSITSLLGQVVLGSHFGVGGIVIGTLLSFVITAAWVLPLNFVKLTRQDLS